MQTRDIEKSTNVWRRLTACVPTVMGALRLIAQAATCGQSGFDFHGAYFELIRPAGSNPLFPGEGPAKVGEYAVVILFRRDRETTCFHDITE